MNCKTEIKIMLTKKDVKQSELARRMGLLPQNLNKKLANNNFKVSEMEKIAELLGFEMNVNFIEK